MPKTAVPEVPPLDTADEVPIALQQQPGHLIRRAHQAAVSTFYEVLGRDVTPIQYAMMLVLQDKPGIDQVTLAQQVALDTSTTADTAVRLEGKGWIARELLSRGQRSLSLTAEGAAVLGTLVPGMRDMQRVLFSNFDADEQAQFLRLLRKFVENESRTSNRDLARVASRAAARKRGAL